MLYSPKEYFITASKSGDKHEFVELLVVVGGEFLGVEPEVTELLCIEERFFSALNFLMALIYKPQATKVAANRKKKPTTKTTM